MKSPTIFSTFFAIFLSLIFIAIGATALYSITTFNNFIFNMEKDGLAEKADILHNLLEIEEFSNFNYLQDFANSAKDHHTRITIIDTNGVVLADSEEDAGLMDNHLNRPELLHLRNGEESSAKRQSDTLNMPMIYYARYIKHNGEKIGYLRTSVSATSLAQRVKTVYITIGVISIVLVFVSIIICYLLALKISGTINSIKRVARHYSKGNFNYSLKETGIEEIVSLSKSINSMGNLLKKRIFTIDKQKNRYKSMLESMTEQVVRLDSTLKVEEMNESAKKLFKQDSWQKMNLLELTNNQELYDFAKNIIRKQGIQKTQITYYKGYPVILQIHGSVLRDQDKHVVGLLLVMSDITEIAHLESMRKEFVANVSHELKTPITTIQGYSETLLSNEIPQDQSRKFLEIIHKNTIRMNNIIQDLLTLAGLDNNKTSFRFEKTSSLDLISMAINTSMPRAEKKGIIIDKEIVTDCNINVSTLLAEQAITNLIQNGIKYSEEGGVIKIRAQIVDDYYTIEVEDTGIGIPKEDLRYIFDRFYRVNKGRSRDQGGSGLGLSIVKRIMDIHKGQVKVKSTLGYGSTFKLKFPV